MYFCVLFPPYVVGYYLFHFSCVDYRLKHLHNDVNLDSNPSRNDSFEIRILTTQKVPRQQGISIVSLDYFFVVSMIAVGSGIIIILATLAFSILLVIAETRQGTLT